MFRGDYDNFHNNPEEIDLLEYSKFKHYETTEKFVIVLNNVRRGGQIHFLGRRLKEFQKFSHIIEHVEIISPTEPYDSLGYILNFKTDLLIKNLKF